MKAFQVPEQLFQATVNYMATKPYNEVNQIMNALFTGTKVVEIPDVQAPPAPPAAPSKGTDDGDKAGT